MNARLAIALAGGIALMAASAQAQDARANYRASWEAIAAYNHCVDQRKDQDLDLSQYEALDDAIMQRIGANLGAAAKLNAIEDAKRRINQAWASKGCGPYSDKRYGIVNQRFGEFTSDLAPVIGVNARIRTTANP